MFCFLSEKAPSQAEASEETRFNDESPCVDTVREADIKAAAQERANEEARRVRAEVIMANQGDEEVAQTVAAEEIRFKAEEGLTNAQEDNRAHESTTATSATSEQVSVTAFLEERGLKIENAADIAAYLDDVFGVESSLDLALLDEDDIEKTIVAKGLRKKVNFRHPESNAYGNVHEFVCVCI